MYSRERELYAVIFKISFSKFDSALHILFGIFLTVQTNLMNLNSREIRRFNVKPFFSSTLLPLLLKQLFATWPESECLPALSTISSVCSVA